LAFLGRKKRTKHPKKVPERRSCQFGGSIRVAPRAKLAPNNFRIEFFYSSCKSHLERSANVRNN